MRLCVIFIVLSGILFSCPATAETEEVTVRAQLKAMNAPLISSEIGGVISHMKLQSGDSFKQGDLLIQIGCSPNEKQLNLAEVILDKKQKVADINQRLNQLGSTSELEIALGSAEVEEARASLDYHRAIVDQCNIYAPFSGRVGDLFVARYQYVNEGEPIMQISQQDKLEIEMFIPSIWLRWIKKGFMFDMEVDETGKTYGAKIDRIASEVDPVSHTVKVFGILVKNAQELLSGMSGKVLITVPDEPVKE